METHNKIVQPEKVLRHQMRKNGRFPNNPVLPVLIYKAAVILDGNDGAGFIQKMLYRNNWKNAWRDGILGHHHFHSNTHEVLVVYNGKAQVELGGPHGWHASLEKGDVVILPVGTAHKKINSSDGFACVGAYPDGINYDMNTGINGNQQEIMQRIRTVEVPSSDPLFGPDGMLFDYWKNNSK